MTRSFPFVWATVSKTGTWKTNAAANKETNRLKKKCLLSLQKYLLALRKCSLRRKENELVSTAYFDVRAFSASRWGSWECAVWVSFCICFFVFFLLISFGKVFLLISNSYMSCSDMFPRHLPNLKSYIHFITINLLGRQIFSSLMVWNWHPNSIKCQDSKFYRNTDVIKCAS